MIELLFGGVLIIVFATVIWMWYQDRKDMLAAEDEEDLKAFKEHNPEESIPFEEIIESLKRDGKL